MLVMDESAGTEIAAGAITYTNQPPTPDGCQLVGNTHTPNGRQLAGNHTHHMAASLMATTNAKS